jgi:deaminated glutathione amidase
MKLKVAIIQSSSTPDFHENLDFVKNALNKAKLENAKLAIFPECIMCWAKSDVTREKAKSLSDWSTVLGGLSKEFAINTVWGGIQVKEGELIYNTALVYSSTGQLITHYEKTHLFQIFMKDKITVDETQTYDFGRTGPVSFTIDDFSIGLTICYDLRFPELYRAYAGVDAIICTAAFTKKTGRAHWEPLLRARAIENQCYVLAAAQCGTNRLNGIQTWGHSMAIDSWGKVIDKLTDEPGVFTIEISKDKINSDREILPALKNRKYRS